MPRNVRNFWLEIYVDGRKSLVKTGPSGKDGGFMITLFQRHMGEVEKAGEIYGVVESNGTLELSYQRDGSKTILWRTRR